MTNRNMRRWVVTFCALLVGLCATGYGKVIYVDDDIVWADDGISWVSAFTYLQDALAVAEPGDEIRVAQGLYKPDRGQDVTPGDRWATFSLPEGVAVFGGYAGLFAADPNERNTERYATVLSGDLMDDDTAVADPCDLYEAPNRTDNSGRVLLAAHVSRETVLDGFIVTGGHARPEGRGRGHGAPGTGGGLWIVSASPVVRNCVFTYNAAWAGGGVYVEGGQPMIRDCRFSMNGAHGDGGGLCCYADQLEMTGCRFESNSARDAGGGVYCRASEIRLGDCAFAENQAAAGGGAMVLTGGALELTRCTYAGNRAYEGAGLYARAFSSSMSVMLSDCTFSRNEADARHFRHGFHGESPVPGGGGMRLSRVQAELKGCVFTANRAEQGAGLDVEANDRCRLQNCIWDGDIASDAGDAIYLRAGALELDRCTLYCDSPIGGGLLACSGTESRTSTDVSVTVTNSILCDGDHGACAVGCDPQNTSITFSNVEGGWPGEGNIDVDPCFASRGYLSRFTNAWVGGDYHLESQAGRWDAAAREWVCDEVSSPCIDAGDPTDSIGEELFPDGGVVNMGAYAGTTQASKSYFGGPLCSVNLAGDTNGDCRIDLNDLKTVLAQWWPAGPVIDEGPRVTFIEPVDGATLEVSSEPITIMAEVSLAATIAKVVFHVSHTTETFTYHGQCEGLQNRNRWSAQWHWSGDIEWLLSGEHVIVFASPWDDAAPLRPSLQLSSGSFKLPEGEYTIAVEITDHQGHTTVSPVQTVMLKRRRVSR